jgi:hypothetical protein
MQAYSRVFTCGKIMVLGALYDTVEKLKWDLLSANSETGILMTATRETEMPFLVRVLPKQGEQLEVTVELASGAFSNRNSPEKEAERLLQTLALIIEDAIAGEVHRNLLKE